MIAHHSCGLEYSLRLGRCRTLVRNHASHVEDVAENENFVACHRHFRSKRQRCQTVTEDVAINMNFTRSVRIDRAEINPVIMAILDKIVVEAHPYPAQIKSVMAIRELAL